VFTRRFQEWRQKRRFHAAIRGLEKEEQSRATEIERLITRQQRLVRQINSLQTVQRMMGWWHTFHVPLGLTLFTAMFIHIVAAMYYKGI
jgi:predicted transcriptional regulator